AAAKTLLDFTPDGTGNLIPLDDFLDIVTRLVIVFGLAFELPLLLVMLNFTGILSGRRLLGWWRVMVLCITIFSAVATP
ncbi:twin-arginine translocase subunit TatC, partial [Streptomyces nanshensis]